MHAPDSESELRTALDAFETSLATPIISGELASWSEQVTASWSKASREVHRHIAELHPKQFRQIAKEDPELMSQVDNMKAEDAALEERRLSLDKTITRLSEFVPQGEPDERKFGEYTEQLRKTGFEFVTRVKKQQVTAATWYIEAFTRDRGVGD